MLTNYIKIAWKVLLRHPFYTFITLFGISLTLTVLMVLTSFLDHLIGAHYPETNRDRTLYIERMEMHNADRTSMTSGPMSYKFLIDNVKTLKTTERATIFSDNRSSNAYANGRKIKLTVRYTDADFWRVASFDFLEGKPYNEQNTTSNDFVAVITDSFKAQYFPDPDAPVVGKMIELENVSFRVIGVVRGSPLTRLFTVADLYLPYSAPNSNYQSGGLRGSFMAMLLAPTTNDVEAVEAEFQDRVRRIPTPGEEYGFKYATIDVPSKTYIKFFIAILSGSNDARAAMFLATLFFLLLMLIGLPAVNLVNVNVSRIIERSSEIGIRKAFGAPIRTLLWQFIIENIFVTLIGGVIALALSALVIHLINSSGWLAYADLAINPTVFLISVLVCLLFGLLSGVLPALRMSKLSIADALKA